MLSWGWIFFIFYFLHNILPSSIFWIFSIIFLVAIYLWTSQGMSIRQKISIAQFSPPRTGEIYLRATFDTTKVTQYLKKVEKETGEKVTITTYVGKALGFIINRSKKLNGRILLGRFVPKKTVDVCFLVAAPGDDLGFSKVDDIIHKSLVEISNLVKPKAKEIREGKDMDKKNIDDTSKILPTFLMGPVASFSAFISNCIGIPVKALGLKRFAFGGVVVTSVGMLGIEDAFAPFTQFFHVPMLALIGAIKDKAVVVDGEIVIRPMMNLNITVDHRYADGAEGGRLFKMMEKIFDEPDMIEDFERVMSFK
jgi:pyruvate dehydrogenase E2 component (dihydrolipoamide acetyltransferase)